VGRLFEVIRESLPIHNPKWQLQFKKELWPGDPTYGGLSYLAYIDILSTAPDGSRTVIDVKTAKARLPVASGMIPWTDSSGSTLGYLGSGT